MEESDHVQLEAKDIAEDGASVPVAVRTDLAGPLTVTLFSVTTLHQLWGDSSFPRSSVATSPLASRWRKPETWSRGHRRREALQRPTPYSGYSGRLRLTKAERQPNGGSDMTGTNDKMRARMKDGAAEIKLLFSTRWKPATARIRRRV